MGYWNKKFDWRVETEWGWVSTSSGSGEWGIIGEIGDRITSQNKVLFAYIIKKKVSFQPYQIKEL